MRWCCGGVILLGWVWSGFGLTVWSRGCKFEKLPRWGWLAYVGWSAGVVCVVCYCVLLVWCGVCDVCWCGVCACCVLVWCVCYLAAAPVSRILFVGIRLQDVQP